PKYRSKLVGMDELTWSEISSRYVAIGIQDPSCFQTSRMVSPRYCERERFRAVQLVVQGAPGGPNSTSRGTSLVSRISTVKYRLVGSRELILIMRSAQLNVAEEALGLRLTS